MIGGCGIRKKILIKRMRRAEEAARPQGLEFERLPSLKKTPSEEARKKGKEAIDRVRMFARETGPRDDSSNEGEGSGTSGTRIETEAPVLQFHTPNVSASDNKQSPANQKSLFSSRSRQISTTSSSAVEGKNSRHTQLYSINASLPLEPEDQVIQYERSEIQQPGHARQFSGTEEPGRLVTGHLPRTQYKKKTFIESDSSG